MHQQEEKVSHIIFENIRLVYIDKHYDACHELKLFASKLVLFASKTHIVDRM